MTARFVVLEGGDASGKSTQARRLADQLDALVTREPGGTAVGEALRAMLLDPANDVAPRAEALMMAASRAQLVAEVIAPALANGRHVVCDRYLASSLAYQGYGSGIDVDAVRSLSLFAIDERLPDLTLLIDVPVDQALPRLGGEPDRFEAEGREFHERVRAGYLQMAAADPDGWVVIDGTGNVEEVAALVYTAVKARLGLESIK